MIHSVKSWWCLVSMPVVAMWALGFAAVVVLVVAEVAGVVLKWRLSG